MAFKGTYARQLARMPLKITETLSIMQSFFSPNWFLAGKYLNFLHLYNSIFSQQHNIVSVFKNYTKTSTHPISPEQNQNTWTNSDEDAPIELLNSCTTLSEAHYKKSHLKVLVEIGVFNHQVAGNYWQRKVDLQKEKKTFTLNAKVCIPDQMSYKILCDSKP